MREERQQDTNSNLLQQPLLVVVILVILSVLVVLVLFTDSNTATIEWVGDNKTVYLAGSGAFFVIVFYLLRRSYERLVMLVPTILVLIAVIGYPLKLTTVHDKYTSDIIAMNQAMTDSVIIHSKLYNEQEEALMRAQAELLFERSEKAHAESVFYEAYKQFEAANQTFESPNIDLTSILWIVLELDGWTLNKYPNIENLSDFSSEEISFKIGINTLGMVNNIELLTDSVDVELQNQLTKKIRKLDFIRKDSTVVSSQGKITFNFVK